jgi:hypothetical protein
MTPAERNSIKEMIRGEVGVNRVQSENILRLMEIKNDIDNSRFESALYGVLEFISRSSDIGSVRYLDDLTKLLNTGGEGFDTARILFDGGPEEDEV